MPSLVKDKDVIATGTQTLLEDMQNGKKKKKKNWESSLTVSYTVKHTFIMSSNPKVRYFLNGSENIYMKTYSMLVRTASQMTISW